MIEEIQLTDFLSHKFTQIRPTRFNIFIGPNMSGKSNVFRALMYLRANGLQDFYSEESRQYSFVKKEDFTAVLHTTPNGERSSKANIHLTGSFPGKMFIESKNPLCNFAIDLSINPETWSYSISVKDPSLPKELELEWNFKKEMSIGGGRSQELFKNPRNEKEEPLQFRLYTGRTNWQYLEFNENAIEDLIAKLFLEQTNEEGKDKEGKLISKRKLTRILLGSNKSLKLIVSKFAWDFLIALNYININPYTKNNEYNLVELEVKDPNNRALSLMELNSDQLFSKLFIERSWTFPILNRELNNIFSLSSGHFEIELTPGLKLKPVLEFEKEKVFLTLLSSGLLESLELIIRLLLTPENGVIILEEPETHIEIGRQEFLLHSIFNLCTKKGHQLFISTHSEHLLYALTNLLKKKIIKIEDVKVFYFSSEQNGFNSIVEEIPFTSNFELSKMPHFNKTIMKELKDTLEFPENE